MAWGDTRGFSYGFIRKRIEHAFGSPAGNLPVTQFDQVAEFLQDYIDKTILGRNNRSKGIQNYQEFKAFVRRQMETKPTRRRKSG